MLFYAKIEARPIYVLRLHSYNNVTNNLIFPF